MDLIKGTLDVLILKTIDRHGPIHGYGVSLDLREASDDAFQVEEGALYPALRRLQRRGLLESEWGVTETGRNAKFYRLTEKGSAALEEEMEGWRRYVDAMASVLYGAEPGEERAG